MKEQNKIRQYETLALCNDTKNNRVFLGDFFGLASIGKTNYSS
jgi:hypothetical protein